MTTVEQSTSYLKGTCYTKSADKTSFEKNEWHGFSKDGYLSNITVNDSNQKIIFHSHWSDDSGNIGDIDEKTFPFDGSKVVNCYFNIVENPSSTSYNYFVKTSYNGYYDFCNEIDKFARDNVEKLSGYSMNELVESPPHNVGTTYWYTFQSSFAVYATTYYHDYINFFGIYLPTYHKTYWLK